MLSISGFFLTKQIDLYIRRRKFIEQHGCRPVAQLPQKTGSSVSTHFFESYEAFKNNTYLRLSQKRFEQNGNTFVSRALGKTEINTCDPEKIKAILPGNFKDFAMGSTRKYAFEPLIGHGIFTADSQHWEKARKIIKPSFTHSDIKDLSMFEDHVEELWDRLPKDNTTKVDMVQLFSDFTIKMVAEFLFGGSETSSTNNVTPVEFAAAFDRGQKTVTRSFVLGPLAKIIPDAHSLPTAKQCRTS